MFQNTLLETQKSCPDLEKLDRGDFCIDTEERDILVKEADARCAEIRKQVATENLARQLIRERMVQEFWRPMKVPGCVVASLESDLSVANYPERDLPDGEQKMVNRLNLFREVELCEREWHVGEEVFAGFWQ